MCRVFDGVARNKTLPAIFALVSVGVLIYSIVVNQELLLGFAFVVIGVFVYLSVRFLRAFEEIARALKRIAEQDRT